MAPALHLGQRVTVAALSDPSSLRRADIVAFRPPASQGLVPKPTIEIKRVIGLPEETIQAINGKVEIDGKPISEPYLAPGSVTTQLPDQRVPAGAYFVLGDRRSNSQDSRSYGAISASVITGRVCAVTGA